ncbi:MAG: hypothetical protein C0596_08425 [Marinilabiliales bacterium]|nr:MAG: hypothetical protein C0596_08425 [Marinilabiliales bacterium]
MKKILRSKLLLIPIIGILLIAFQPQKASACEIEFEVTNNKKEAYSVGYVLVIKVTVNLTHKSCPIGMEKTKFTMKGMKILGTTDWLQESSMVWTRKIKVQIIEKDGKNIVLNANRVCDKDGGFGSLKLEYK